MKRGILGDTILNNRISYTKPERNQQIFLYVKNNNHSNTIYI